MPSSPSPSAASPSRLPSELAQLALPNGSVKGGFVHRLHRIEDAERARRQGWGRNENALATRGFARARGAHRLVISSFEKKMPTMQRKRCTRPPFGSSVVASRCRDEHHSQGI